MRSVQIFASSENQVIVEKFDMHLKMVKKSFTDTNFLGITYVEQIVDQQVDEIPEQYQPFIMIVLLNQASLLACIEMQSLSFLVKHANLVVPIIVSHCDWKDHHSPFKNLQALPRSRKTVVEYSDINEILAELAGEIRRILK